MSRDIFNVRNPPRAGDSILGVTIITNVTVLPARLISYSAVLAPRTGEAVCVRVPLLVHVAPSWTVVRGRGAL